jgi:hypothetical protein
VVGITAAPPSLPRITAVIEILFILLVYMGIKAGVIRFAVLPDRRGHFWNFTAKNATRWVFSSAASR